MRQSTMQSTLPSTLTIAALLLPTIPVTAADRTDSPPNVATDGFRFNFTDISYAELFDEFEWKTGWRIAGPRPGGLTTLDCGREAMTFELARTRLNVTCFDATGQAFFVPRRNERALEIIRAADVCVNRWGLNWIFVSVEKFAQSTRNNGEMTMLLQDCRHSPPSRIVEHQELLPSYVLVAEHPGKSSLSVFAAAADIRLYAPLLDMLDIALLDDDATVAEITLQRTEPDDLANIFAPLHPTAVIYHRLRQERQTEPPGSVPELRIWSDWAHRRVVVAGTASAVEKAQQLGHVLDTPSVND